MEVAQVKALLGSLVGATVLYLVGPIEVSITPTWITIQLENQQSQMSKAPPLVFKSARQERCMR